MRPRNVQRVRGGNRYIATVLARLRLAGLLSRWPAKLVWALYTFVNGFLTIGLLAVLAVLTHNPFVFPSLGPTAYLFFFSPLAEAASPRNAVLGHAIALACGYGAFFVTGLTSFQNGFPTHLLWPRVIAAALSLSTTGAAMVLAEVNHPPAGATTLIVALGIISRPRYLLVIEGAVALLTVQAFAINRLAGLSYPVWDRRASQQGEDRSER
jgi:CBS domain-containing membrane protein